MPSAKSQRKAPQDDPTRETEDTVPRRYVLVNSFNGEVRSIILLTPEEAKSANRIRRARHSRYRWIRDTRQVEDPPDLFVGKAIPFPKT